MAIDIFWATRINIIWFWPKNLGPYLVGYNYTIWIDCLDNTNQHYQSGATITSPWHKWSLTMTATSNFNIDKIRFGLMSELFWIKWCLGEFCWIVWLSRIGFVFFGWVGVLVILKLDLNIAKTKSLNCLRLTIRLGHWQESVTSDSGATPHSGPAHSTF